MSIYNVSYFRLFMRSGIMIVMLGSLVSMMCCTDFVRVDIPQEIIGEEVVFGDDSVAMSAIRGIYSSMMQGSTFASGDNISVGYVAGISSDEFVWLDEFLELTTKGIDRNQIQTNDPSVAGVWSSCYTTIFYANKILEGLVNSKRISPETRVRLEGEARFVRAFAYFYLVNLYGNVPLILTTDYERNKQAHRDPVDVVYAQIIEDLNHAIMLLKNYSSRRTRPGVWAAHALLARVYLYRQDWVSAEEHATAVINNAEYALESDVNRIFLASSKEAIWQLRPVYEGSGMGTFEAIYFFVYPMLSPDVAGWFEKNDSRQVWIGETVTSAGNIAYYPYKYRVQYIPPDGSIETEYSIVLRLAEQYLIRAEARASLENINGAIQDVDMIRQRAGLPLLAEVSPMPDQKAVLASIQQERRIEFLGEWGHRWLDLKRTGQVGAVMSLQNPETWQSTDALYPVPFTEILNDNNLNQNDGY